MALNHNMIVSSFTAAMWLVARGFEPLHIGANPARGKVEFVFPLDAKDAWRDYYTAKGRLDQMTQAALKAVQSEVVAAHARLDARCTPGGADGRFVPEFPCPTTWRGVVLHVAGMTLR